MENEFNEAVFVQLDTLDYNIRINGDSSEFSHFCNNPKEYRSDFMKYAKVSELFIAGHYYGSDSPYLFTRSDAKSPDFKIRTVADISCDIDGPVACTLRPSTILDPLYGYNPQTEAEDVYNKQDQARKVVDGKESFVNELETIRGFETVSFNEEAQIITEQDLKILYPKQRQQRSFDFTQGQVDAALSTDTKSKKVIAKGLQPKEGQKVGIRLNLNVLRSKKIPIQTVHEGQVGDNYKKVDGKSGFFNGEAINYSPAVTLKDAYFNTSQRGVYNIQKKNTYKTPIASVDGLYQEVPLADTNFDGVEIRFNPMTGNLFETMDGKPVRFVEEATVVGFRVYGRGKIEYFTEANKPKPYNPTSEKAKKSFKQRQQLPDGYFVEERGRGEFTLMKENRRAGEMSIAELQSDKPSVSQVYLRPTDKGLGLAPDMYREIAKAMRSKGKTLVSSKYTNNASQGVWKRLVKDGDGEVIGSRIDAEGKLRNMYSFIPSKPKQRQQKESKPTVEKLANFYAMDNKGFIKS